MGAPFSSQGHKAMGKFKRSDLIDYVASALADAGETYGKVAGDIVATVIGHVIKALRADPGIPARSLTHWELALADAANRAASDLPHHLDGLIESEQAIEAIEDFFTDCSPDDKPGAPQAGAG
jgi:hypothetical protein